MKRAYFHILRVGLAITFLWISVLIFKSPESWGTFLQPWAAGLLPIPLKTAMIGTAIFDAATGFILLIDVGIWIVSLLATLHIISVLIVVGITDVTVRDIGLLAATVALLLDSLPAKIKSKLFKE